MKKQYTITTGEYSSFRIVARIEGESSPALSTLKKDFDARFGFPQPPRKPFTSVDLIAAFIGDKSSAERRARQSGLEGDGRAELFIDWLVRYHSYVVLKDNEVWIG